MIAPGGSFAPIDPPESHRIVSSDQRHPSFRSLICMVAVGLAVATLAACGGDGGSPVTPGPPAPHIAIVAGGGVSDTIYTRPATPLTVEVRDAAGRPIADTPVRFAVDSTRVAIVYLISGPGPFPHAFVHDVRTDDAGRARVSMLLGDFVGEAVISISAAAVEVSSADTVVVRRGAPDRLMGALDTAVFIGGTTELGVVVADRSGNPHPDVVTYASSDPAVSVSVTGTISGRSFGQATITATSGRLSTTLRVGVVPPGTIAVREFGSAAENRVGVAVLDLDLSNYRFLTTSLTKKSTGSGGGLPAVSPRWHPDGARIVFAGGYDDGWNGDPARVSVTHLSGGVHALLPPPAPTFTTDPAFTKDGAWLYFAGMVPGTSSYALWRAHADGSAAERLAPSSPLESGIERRPDPSPDGSLVAYAVGEHPTGPRLRVRNVVTGARTALDVRGISPRWSPTGDLIAFVVSSSYRGFPGELHLIRPDGTGARRLTTGIFDPVFDWSPDGKYIVAEQAGYLVIIDVASGVIVPLIGGSRFSEPAWKPMPR